MPQRDVPNVTYWTSNIREKIIEDLTLERTLMIVIMISKVINRLLSSLDQGSFHYCKVCDRLIQAVCVMSVKSGVKESFVKFHFFMKMCTTLEIYVVINEFGFSSLYVAKWNCVPETCTTTWAPFRTKHCFNHFWQFK